MICAVCRASISARRLWKLTDRTPIRCDACGAHLGRKRSLQSWLRSSILALCWLSVFFATRNARWPFAPLAFAVWIAMWWYVEARTIQLVVVEPSSPRFRSRRHGLTVQAFIAALSFSPLTILVGAEWWVAGLRNETHVELRNALLASTCVLAATAPAISWLLCQRYFDLRLRPALAWCAIYVSAFIIVALASGHKWI